ncbi:Gfo/Idh/MocA family oxidoreductase [Paenirhodobacter populi]|nr:Gfo/Idh/MocA family oxidoreductase [Sinirhodobacter populi]
MHWHALGTGRHVLIEKPMCMTLPEANELGAAACDAARVVQIGYMRRHTPTFEKARQLVDAMAGGINMARVRAIIGPNSTFLTPTTAVISGEDMPSDMLDEATEALATRSVAGTTEGPRAFVHKLLLGL